MLSMLKNTIHVACIYCGMKIYSMIFAYVSMGC